ncbi:GGDEF domain-containing protein [Microvirga sp. VF16]|uniref:GGDEF domain-containing protein n=1 Tax=Microvirga sp. VF16 TaxID=2807101 RepID=UPI00193DC34C|nr:GGDEF domain-containing protein [Microvirga sp. VF16]QRM31535.1 GGDEF domain-containing protein [Microvirga sp. VF16]
MPTITSQEELVRYVVMVTLFALAVSLSADITIQLVFFTSWTAVARTFVVTTLTVGVIAIPVSYIFGRAQRELQEAKRRLEGISRTDPLTGLPNRRALIEASKAPARQAMVLVIADIDHFNAINDSHGHRTGDLVLQMLGKTMEAHLSDYGLVGHMRGEEFALISSTTPVERIVDAIGDLLRAVERTPIITPGGAVQVTMSAGIALRGPSDTFEKLYGDADEALYEAKRMGRGQIKLSERAKDVVLAGHSAERMNLILKF